MQTAQALQHTAAVPTDSGTVAAQRHSGTATQTSVCQPPGPDIGYSGPREVLLEFVILVF